MYIYAYHCSVDYCYKQLWLEVGDHEVQFMLNVPHTLQGLHRQSAWGNLSALQTAAGIPACETDGCLSGAEASSWATVWTHTCKCQKRPSLPPSAFCDQQNEIGACCLCFLQAHHWTAVARALCAHHASPSGSGQQAMVGGCVQIWPCCLDLRAQ